MKYKILSAVIATALLSACSDSAKYDVKAYDPAVANMDGHYNCTDGSKGHAGGTNGLGIVQISAATPLNAPSTCKFTLIARSNAVDMSNGKPMAGVTYIIPKGMAESDTLVTASPLSTLLAKTLGDALYTEAAAVQLLIDLGLVTLTNNADVSIAEIMLDPEAAANKLSAAEKSKLLATAAVVSDVIKNTDSTDSAEDVTAAAKTLSETTLATYPAYPSNGTNDIFLTIPEALVNSTVAAPTTPVSGGDLPTPEVAEVQVVTPTGGTGGGGPDDGTGS